jgi:aldehyde:ferredoxin oxidoreductase
MGYSDTPGGDVLKAVTGHDFTPRLMEIGARIYTLERLILSREGVTRRNDLLPERISKEPIPSGPARGHVLTAEMYDIMLNEYYAQRGWDQNGVPNSDTVEKLGLSKLVSLQ